MANKYRNEVDVELNGNKYTLRPTFTCLAEIEEFLNKSIFEFRADILVGKLRAKQAFFVLDSGIRAAGREVDAATLQRDLAESGWDATLLAVAKFIQGGIFAGDLAKKNLNPTV